MTTPRFVWFITGASRGLGRSLVEATLTRGDRVVATLRRPERLDDLKARYADTLLTLALDVNDASAAKAAVAAALERFGRLDVVVNNAGYANLASVEDTTLEDFQAQLDTNLMGVVNVTKAVLPVLRTQGSGHLINVSSVGGRVGTPGLGAYQTAKWAVNGFTEVVAAEVTPLGIKVTTVEPGGMQTDWGGSSMTVPTPSAPYRPTIDIVAQLIAKGPTMALGDPRKVADAIVQVAAMTAPPLRLLLGSDALAAARAAASTTERRDAQWDELSRSTDRDDATEAQRDPLQVRRQEPTVVVKRFIDEVVNGGRIEVLGELWDEDLEWHGGSLGNIRGLAAYRKFLAANAAGAFSGMRLEVHDVMAAGNKVVVRFTNSGDNTGPFMGNPPSGKHAEWLGIGIYEVENGKITKAWFGEDILGMLMQLGAFRPAA